LAEAVIDSYMERQEIPQTAPEWVGVELALPTELRGKLMTELRKVISEKQRIEWLNKGGSSITPEQTPEFFSGGAAAEPKKNQQKDQGSAPPNDARQ
jgi:hypothetical protein